MSLFSNLGNPRQAPPANPMQALTELQKNPVSFLRQMGYDIPDGMTNPQQIAQHLVTSGQRTNSMLEMAMKMMGM